MLKDFLNKIKKNKGELELNNYDLDKLEYTYFNIDNYYKNNEHSHHILLNNFYLECKNRI